MSPTISVLIPASNEARYIGTCLKALLASDPVPGFTVEIIVIANGCSDDTAAIARRFTSMAEPRGWRLRVLELKQGSKIKALNTGDDTAIGQIRVYLDADVVVSAGLLSDLAEALNISRAQYATGTPKIAPSPSLATRLYARFWQSVPFMRDGAPGFGVYAVNAEGRSRWAKFPAIISDDTFVRLQFASLERVQVRATYQWPLVDGFRNLVRVRRRQDAGVDEIADLYPDLMARDTKPDADIWALMRADPLGFLVYSSVALFVRMRRKRKSDWTRGR